MVISERFLYSSNRAIDINSISYNSCSIPSKESGFTFINDKLNDVCIFLKMILFLFSVLYFVYVYRYISGFLIFVLNQFFGWRNSVEFLFSLMLIMHSGTTERMFREINNSRNLCVELRECWMLNAECSMLALGCWLLAELCEIGQTEGTLITAIQWELSAFAQSADELFDIRRTPWRMPHMAAPWAARKSVNWVSE